MCQQLLTHTSGIQDYEEIQTYQAYRFRVTPEEILRVAQLLNVLWNVISSRLLRVMGCGVSSG